MSNAADIRIKHLFISPGHNFFGHHDREPSQHPMIECAEMKCLAGRGIEGDRFLDFKADYKGQVTFFSNEVYEELCTRLDMWDKPPSVFRRNIITENVDLNSLIGREFEIQNVRFLGVAECSPCHWQDGAFSPGTHEALKDRGGLRAKILCDGVLKAEQSG